jgi:RNAse (barnase) inhibitor barstar
MSDLNRLFGRSRTPGVYRSDADPADLNAALARAGWATALLGPATTTEGFYAEVASALDLPEYFGRNLDALWDCLTDLDVPTVVIVGEWTRFAQAQPARWAAILAVFEERCARSPAFAVVLA